MTGNRQTLTIAKTWEGCPIPASEQARVAFWLEGETLRVTLEAPEHGDPLPAGPPGRTPGLWEYEVVELFVVGPDGHYLEIELGPGGHHLALTFSAPREVRDPGVPVSLQVTRAAGRWRGEATVSLRWCPLPVVAANAFAIHGVGGDRRFLVAAPTGGERPDFHRPDRFPSIDPPLRR